MSWILVIVFSSGDGVPRHVKENSEQHTEARFVEKQFVGCASKQDADKDSFRDVGESLGQQIALGVVQGCKVLEGWIPVKVHHGLL